nr:11671_t:CDS:1 [Entrophospora candida]
MIFPYFSTSSTTILNSSLERNDQLYQNIKQLEDKINNEKLSITKFKEKINQVTANKYNNYKNIGIMEYMLACKQHEALELQFKIIDLRIERQNLIRNHKRKVSKGSVRFNPVVKNNIEYYEKMFERSVKFAEEQVITNYARYN